jgi:hypothetical protein
MKGKFCFLVHGRSAAVHRDGGGLGPPGRRGPGRQAGYPQPATPQETRPRHAGSVLIPDDFYCSGSNLLGNFGSGSQCCGTVMMYCGSVPTLSTFEKFWFWFRFRFWFWFWFRFQFRILTYLAQFFNNKKCGQNLDFSMLESRNSIVSQKIGL